MTLEFGRIEINKLVRAKRRSIALIIEKDGSLTIRAPRRVSMAEIESFVGEKTDWIIRTRERIKAVVEIPKKKFEDGEIFSFLGMDYPLRLVRPQRPALKFDGGFSLGYTAQKRGESAFTRWYKEQAFAVISERVQLFSGQYGFMPKQVKISSAKTRWGSCSPDGTLNFTWRLVMAPLEVIDYVIVHELAHLRVRDHSRKFWLEVERILPEYKAQRKWLRIHGEGLRL